jgi:hypothetical protein
MTTADRLAAYLAVLEADGQPVLGGTGGDGGRGRGGSAPELRSGQFHDVVLAGSVAYRFPRDEESRRLLPGRVALLTALGERELPVAVPVPLGANGLDRPLGRCYVPLTRLAGTPAGPGLLDDPSAAGARVAVRRVGAGRPRSLGLRARCSRRRG